MVPSVCSIDELAVSPCTAEKEIERVACAAFRWIIAIYPGQLGCLFVCIQTFLGPSEAPVVPKDWRIVKARAVCPRATILRCCGTVTPTFLGLWAWFRPDKFPENLLRYNAGHNSDACECNGILHCAAVVVEMNVEIRVATGIDFGDCN